MPRTAKLYAAVVADPRAQLSFRDFERLLAAFGFRLVRTNGSHLQFAHPNVTRILTVQPRGKDAKTYQVVQFITMIQEFGLELGA